MKKIILITFGFALVGVANSQTPNKKKLFVSNVNDGVVYIDEQPEYVKDKYCSVELRLSNPVAKIEMKEPVSLKLDNKYFKDYKKLKFETGYWFNEKNTKNTPRKLMGTAVQLVVYDSASKVPDINNPGKYLPSPISIPFEITNPNVVYQLTIPAGTFTDIYGNKNEDISILYKKRK